MKQATAYIIELTGTALVLLWVFRNPAEFNRLTTAASSVTVGSVRALQGR